MIAIKPTNASLIITEIMPILCPKKVDRRYLVLECNDNRLQDVDYFQNYSKKFIRGARKLIDDAQRHKEAVGRSLSIDAHNYHWCSDRERALICPQWLMEQIEPRTLDGGSSSTCGVRGYTDKDAAMRMRRKDHEQV